VTIFNESVVASAYHPAITAAVVLCAGFVRHTLGNVEPRSNVKGERGPAFLAGMPKDDTLVRASTAARAIITAR
jgi:hypothetical protein